MSGGRHLGDGPKHACSAFPICKNQQCKLRNPDGTRPRAAYCLSCYNSDRLCQFPCCARPAVPAFKTDKAPSYCAVHLSDPSTAPSRCWNMCSNADVGCRNLALERHRGPCYQCKNRCLPCANALRGCFRHSQPVKTKQRVLLECVSHAHQKCPFGASVSNCCAMQSCSAHVSKRDAFCDLCADGLMPCSKMCGLPFRYHHSEVGMSHHAAAPSRWRVGLDVTYGPLTFVQVCRHCVSMYVCTSNRYCFQVSESSCCTTGDARSVDVVSWGCAACARFVILFTAKILAMRLLQYRCPPYATQWQVAALLIVQRPLVLTPR